MKINIKKLLLAACAISLLLAVMYAGIRLTQISRLQQQLHALETRTKKQTATQSDVGFLKKKFPPHGDTASFAETLYDVAKKSGLENVEVSTGSNVSIQPRAKTPGKEDSKSLRHYEIKISGEGRYRAIAHYLGQLSAVDRYNNALTLEMKPDRHTIKTNIVIEVISFEGQDAS